MSDRRCHGCPLGWHTYCVEISQTTYLKGFLTIPSNVPSSSVGEPKLEETSVTGTRASMNCCLNFHVQLLYGHVFGNKRSGAGSGHRSSMRVARAD